MRGTSHNRKIFNREFKVENINNKNQLVISNNHIKIRISMIKIDKMFLTIMIKVSIKVIIAEIILYRAIMILKNDLMNKEIKIIKAILMIHALEINNNIIKNHILKRSQ